MQSSAVKSLLGLLAIASVTKQTAADSCGLSTVECGTLIDTSGDVCTFANLVLNECQDTGAFDLKNSEMSLIATTINDCSGYSAGGAVNVQYGTSAGIGNFYGSEITDSYASANGGGVHVKSSTASFFWTRLDSNVAGDSGGAIEVHGDDGSVYAEASECTNNQASYGGCIVLSRSGEGSQVSVTFDSVDVSENAVTAWGAYAYVWGDTNKIEYSCCGGTEYDTRYSDLNSNNMNWGAGSAYNVEQSCTYTANGATRSHWDTTTCEASIDDMVCSTGGTSATDSCITCTDVPAGYADCKGTALTSTSTSTSTTAVDWGSFPKGDLNYDGNLDVLDAVKLVSWVLYGYDR